MKQTRNKKTYMRIDNELLSKLVRLKQPCKKSNHKIESYADVIRRLLKEHWAEMMKEKEEANR